MVRFLFFVVFVCVFDVFVMDGGGADTDGTISEIGQTPVPCAQGQNKLRGQTPRSDLRHIGPALRQIAAPGPLGPFWAKNKTNIYIYIYILLYGCWEAMHI